MIAGNTKVGIQVESSTATVERSVIRDTWPGHGVGSAGNGILCNRYKDNARPELVLRDSVVARNARYGVFAEDAVLEVARSLVLDTQGPETGPELTIEAGVVAQLGTSIRLSDSLVAGNLGSGLVIASAEAAIRRCVVRDTRRQATGWKQQYGVIVARLGDPAGTGRAASGRLEDTLIEMPDAVAGSSSSLAAWDAELVVERTRIVGAHLFAGEATPGGGGSQLTARELLVAESPLVGVSVGCGSRASLERSRVRATRSFKGLLGEGTPNPIYLDGLGDGVEAFTCDAPASTAVTTLDLVETVVEVSARAGLFLDGVTGSVRRSAFRKGALSIVLQGSGAILEDNLFQDNLEDRLSFGENLTPAPPPTCPSF